MIAPYAIEICPTCGVEFTASLQRPVTGQDFKACPNGHRHTKYELKKARRAADIANPPETPPDTTEADALKLALGLMLAAYEQAQRTLPPKTVPGAMLAGAFQNSVRIAEELLA